MKTAEQRAEEWLKQNIGVNATVGHMVNLVKLLKEQDRDTRHACANAVINCEYRSMYGDKLNVSDAHMVIMNTKTV